MGLRDRKDRQQIVVRMAAAARIGVVAFEIAAGDAVGEGGQLRQRAMRCADHRRAVRHGCPRRHRARHARGLRVERRNGAADGVDDPPLAVVHDLCGQVRKGQPVREFGHAFRAVVHDGARNVGKTVASGVAKAGDRDPRLTRRRGCAKKAASPHGACNMAQAIWRMRSGMRQSTKSVSLRVWCPRTKISKSAARSPLRSPAT